MLIRKKKMSKLGEPSKNGRIDSLGILIIIQPSFMVETLLIIKEVLRNRTR